MNPNIKKSDQNTNTTELLFLCKYTKENNDNFHVLRLFSNENANYSH